MVTIEVALLISFFSLLLSAFNTFKGNKRADTTDIERRAAENAVTNTKLDGIAQDVRDIKYDITTVKKDVQGLNERLIKVEQSVKSAHHRLDGITGEREGAE